MVAISLYRGNLHRVSDLPRRWLMPAPQISLKDFKNLFRRRSLFRTRSRAAPAAATTPYPNSDPNTGVRAESSNDVVPQSEPSPTKVSRAANAASGDPTGKVNDCPAKPLGDDVSVPGPSFNSNSEFPQTKETHCKEAFNEKDRRKEEVEVKLRILNKKKHNFVQVLKQILNAEKELKRRSSMPPLAGRSPIPLQVDVTIDPGPMNRHVSPRMGPVGNLDGNMKGGEANDLLTPHMYSRHLIRMSNISPSLESPFKRPVFCQHNVVLHHPHGNFGVTSSPSRFAPMCHQGQNHVTNFPPVSVSGTNFIVSSPSPAASGGTSAFPDARLPSPWN